MTIDPEDGVIPEPGDDEDEGPDKLRRKWDMEDFEEELFGKTTKPCTACGKYNDEKSLACLYCGERLFTKSGPLGRMASWITHGRFLSAFFFLFLLIVLVLTFLRFR